MKRLDTFIISKFLQLFAGAFFVCLFVFMMQFTWRYVDDLVGKGLTFDILAQFFGYMALTLVPQSLPLAILLASLITFGNMGENLELLSMKAAGVPLTRIMRPLVIFVFLVAGTSFYFQNSTAPDAQKSLRQLLISMRQSQPAVEIPEGIFYNGVPNVNLYVDHKETKTGMLYGVIIYKTDEGFDKAQVVVADSGRMEMTADKLHLRLTLWAGVQYQSLQGDNNMTAAKATMPYDRETFVYKDFLVEFDSNFNLLDSEMLGNIPSAKNMREIEHDADSMSVKLDSAALQYVNTIERRQIARRKSLTREDSVRLAKDVKAHPKNFDAILAKADDNKRLRAITMAKMQVEQMSNDLTWKNEMKKDEEKWIRRHWIEWHTKITLSLACIFFFFIGAPLGAIIRKGGLGMPSIISVGIFIFYYIINTSGMKMAREGNINLVLGMWISSAVLAPAGVYLTFMSNRDSQVFNIDAYRNFFRKLFGIRQKRNIGRKEVIISAPDYNAALSTIGELKTAFGALRISRLRLVNFFRFRKNPALANEVARLEALIEELSNSRDLHILRTLNRFPVVSKRYLHKDRRSIMRALAILERDILVFQGKQERRRKVRRVKAVKPTVAAQQQQYTDSIVTTPVIIALSDETNYEEALAKVVALKRECGRLRISKWGFINSFRYRNPELINRIEHRKQLLIGLFASSNDLMLQRILADLPKMQKKGLRLHRQNYMRTLSRLEKRINVIIDYKAKPHELPVVTPEPAAEATAPIPVEATAPMAPTATEPVEATAPVAPTTTEPVEAQQTILTAGQDAPQTATATVETTQHTDVPKTTAHTPTTELASILVSIDSLRRECGSLRISKWGIVNFFRYRNTAPIDSIVKRTKNLRDQLATVEDSTLIQLRNQLPKLTRGRLLEDRRTIMRTLAKIEQRINEI